MGTNTEYKERNERQIREQWRTQDALAGRSGCFPASTLVLTPTGPRPILEISAGEMVVSLDPQTGERFHRRVVRRKDYMKAQLWEIVTDGRSTPITTTRHHLFLTQRGWVQARRLRSGDELQTASSLHAKVVDVWKTEVLAPVHNLITEGEHTFIADGCIVHNFAYCRALRTWLHQRWESLSAKRLRGSRLAELAPGGI